MLNHESIIREFTGLRTPTIHLVLVELDDLKSTQVSHGGW